MLETDKLDDFEQIREHTSKQVSRAVRAESPVLVEAPPSSGKTMSALAMARDTELPPITYYTERTDLYQQAKEWAEEYEQVEAMVIPSPHRDCPTFRGDTDQSPEVIKRLYQKGESAYRLHMKPKDEAYTPCMNPGCPYIGKMRTLDNQVDNIDLLIGNHLHARRERYNEDRIVILDEFNSDPFLTSFPSDSSTVVDDPGKLIPEFLSVAQDHGFPSEVCPDLTAVVERRRDEDIQSEVCDWFSRYSARRDKVETHDFISTTANRYDATHIQAPLLVLSLFCMEPVGCGYELAPGPSGRYNQAWRDAGLHPNIKCVRNRNTGEMHVLRPPNLSSANQIVGLDALPTPELWNLLFATEDKFERYTIISREAYPTFLDRAMNMDLVQLGNGVHHYGTGQPSQYDKHRFATIRLREDRQFALISSKNALDHYDNQGLLDQHIAPAEEIDDDSNKEHPTVKARHYGIIRSSNDFADEPLGAVFGTPHPSDAVIQRWSAFCGEVGEPEGRGTDKEFDRLTQSIYEHFVHNQVVQAVLRFGRSEETRLGDGSTVYISTEALPPWFEVDHHIGVRQNSAESAIISKIMAARKSQRKLEIEEFTVSNVETNLNISRRHVRNTLENLVDEGVLEVSPRETSDGADVYRWANDDRLRRDEEIEKDLLMGNNNTYVLPTD